jgi:RNA-directed DNA polymerase
VPVRLVSRRRDLRYPGNPVRALQHALYRAAKADPGRRFHALYDKICGSDVLWRVWVAERSSNGAPGIDRISLAAVEEYGVTRLLGRAGHRAAGRSSHRLPRGVGQRGCS